MSGCQRNGVGSLILDHSAYSDAGAGGIQHNHIRLWHSVSGSAFRRKIINTLRCGGGGGRISGLSRATATTISDDEDDDRLQVLPPKSVQKMQPQIIDKLKKSDSEGRGMVTRVNDYSSSGASGRSGSEKLLDLLNLSETPSSPVSANPNSTPNLNLSSDECRSDDKAAAASVDVEEVKRKEERFSELSSSVRILRSEVVEEKETGAKAVRRLAKEDSEARNILAMLGAIPPLVGMLDDCDHGGSSGVTKEKSIEEALYALLNLGIGNDRNKAAIVQAGAIHNMLKLIEFSNGSPQPAVSEAIVANVLALSALDFNKPIIGSSGVIPFLVKTLKDLDEKNVSHTCTAGSSNGSSSGTSSGQAKQDTLRALYNLSILPSNIPLILETDLVPYLMSDLGDMEVSDRILSILSRVTSIPEGRKAISAVGDAFPVLIDVLNWTDSPGCQEKASYILMVMAHKGYSDRQAMIEAGISSVLLELTLLGSTLAQNRASRILECLRVERGKQVSGKCDCGASVGASPVSAPICGPTSKGAARNFEKGLKSGDEVEDMMMSDEKKAVKQLVQQSLQNNMRRIVKRANLPQDFVPSEHLKSLASSSTSKSVPF